jgi:hypothetical protein
MFSEEKSPVRFPLRLSWTPWHPRAPSISEVALCHPPCPQLSTLRGPNGCRMGFLIGPQTWPSGSERFSNYLSSWVLEVPVTNTASHYSYSSPDPCSMLWEAGHFPRQPLESVSSHPHWWSPQCCLMGPIHWECTPMGDKAGRGVRRPIMSASSALRTCETLDNSLNLFRPQFPHV